MQSSQKDSQNLATQVQHIETTYLPNNSNDFRTYSSGRCQEELSASQLLYSTTDRISGKSNEEKFCDCRRHAWFSVSFLTRKVRIATNSCRLRWCPLCSQALTRYRTWAIKDWLDQQGPTRFLTLTLKHTTKSLSEQIDDVYYYFKQLRKIVYFSQVCTGGIWFFQVKRSSRTGEWHPHLHCLITGSYIIHPRLSEIWERITGGSTVVDIRTISDENAVAKYVSRYSARPASLAEFSESDRVDIYNAMHGRRLCGTWGTGKEVILSPKRKIDLSEWRKIGTWETVVRHAPFHSYSRLVFKCWKQNRALPDFIDLQCLDRPEQLFTDSDMQNLCLLQFYEEDET